MFCQWPHSSREQKRKEIIFIGEKFPHIAILENLSSTSFYYFNPSIFLSSFSYSSTIILIVDWCLCMRYAY